MGNLVFQATLGGQVNLVGPNTASTYNINVPTVNGNLVTTGDTGTVTNTMLAGSIANAKLTNSSVTIGSTSISLGATSTTLAGLTSVGTTTVGSPSSSNLSIQSNGTTNATLDTSGNLGLGVTPSAWASGTYALQLKGGAIYNNGAQDLRIGSNVYIGTGNQYITTGAASFYEQSNGSHNWQIAASGSANASISFTQAMTLDASGNLGVGTTSPARRLHVSATNDCLARVESTTGGSAYLELLSSTQSLASYSRVQGKYGSSVDWEIGGGAGTVSTLIMATGGSERARIDSSGNLLVGTTSALSKLTVNDNISISAAGGTIYAASFPTTASAANVYIGASNSYMYRSTSALKYKQDIRDLEEINIDLLRPVRYKSKCENDDQTIDHFGVIADEAHNAGLTELVNYGETGEVEGFQYERLTVVLLKKLQTQQAIITQLQADVAALKGQA